LLSRSVNSDIPNLLPQRGHVVVVDPRCKGCLKISENRYDRSVIGIISGANDINPGLILHQEETVMDGKYPVAIAGQVYVYAEATKHAISIGDFVTTSDIPGYVMKSLRQKGKGAIIGKAITSLDKGKKGFVLILVIHQ